MIDYSGNPLESPPSGDRALVLDQKTDRACHKENEP